MPKTETLPPPKHAKELPDAMRLFNRTLGQLQNLPAPLAMWVIDALHAEYHGEEKPDA